jgi:hypothetical protein
MKNGNLLEAVARIASSSGGNREPGCLFSFFNSDFLDGNDVHLCHRARECALQSAKDGTGDYRASKLQSVLLFLDFIFGDAKAIF